MKRKDFNFDFGLLAVISLTAFSRAYADTANKAADSDVALTKGDGLNIQFKHGMINETGGLRNMNLSNGGILKLLFGASINLPPDENFFDVPLLIVGSQCSTFGELKLFETLSNRILNEAGCDPPGIGFKEETFVEGFYVLYWSKFGFAAKENRQWLKPLPK